MLKCYAYCYVTESESSVANVRKDLNRPLDNITRKIK